MTSVSGSFLAGAGQARTAAGGVGVEGSGECGGGERWEQFAERHGDYGRNMVLCMARENTGLTLRELGEAAGGMDYAAVGEAVRRLRKRLKEDRSIRKAYKHAVQILQIET
jgi:hypothetical protein